MYCPRYGLTPLQIFIETRSLPKRLPRFLACLSESIAFDGLDSMKIYKNRRLYPRFSITLQSINSTRPFTMYDLIAPLVTRTGLMRTSGGSFAGNLRKNIPSTTACLLISCRHLFTKGIKNVCPTDEVFGNFGFGLMNFIIINVFN